MKVAISLCLCLALALAVEIPTKTVERIIIADVLRDFPGVCYASTQCRTFKDGEEWDLKPFCGMAKCVKNADGKLEEHVRDCGLIAKEDDNCKISAKTNATLPFPNCCPIYDCVDGKTPTFPTSP